MNSRKRNSYRDIDQITALIGAMDSSNPPIKPIILRYNAQNIADYGTMFGFHGILIKSSQRISDGASIMTTKIDPNKQLYFYADSNGSQWGVIPDCDFNRKTLLNCAKTIPITIIEAPKDLVEKFEVAKNSQTPEPIREPLSRKELKQLRKDPFFGVKCDQTMPVEGEASKDNGGEEETVEEVDAK